MRLDACQQRGQFALAVGWYAVHVGKRPEPCAGLPAAEQMQVGKGGQLAQDGVQQVRAFVLRQAAEHDQGQTPAGQILLRLINAEWQKVAAVLDDMCAHAGKGRHELTQMADDRITGRDQLDFGALHQAQIAGAQCVPGGRLLILEQVVERVVLEAGAEARAVTGLTDLVEGDDQCGAEGKVVVRTHQRGQAAVEGIQRMADDRRDQDDIHFEVADDFGQDGAVLVMGQRRRPNRRVQGPFPQRSGHGCPAIQGKPLTKAPPGADRAQHQVVALGIGFAHVLYPLAQTTPP